MTIPQSLFSRLSACILLLVLGAPAAAQSYEQYQARQAAQAAQSSAQDTASQAQGQGQASAPGFVRDTFKSMTGTSLEDVANRAAGISGGPQPNPQPMQLPAAQGAPASLYPPSRMFGAQLFNGHFAMLNGSGFNPDYRLAIGDKVLLRIWGGVNFTDTLVIDSHGNLFIPEVGPVQVAGLRNGDLNQAIRGAVSSTFRAGANNIYATLDLAQPVKVFVTGYVRNPGLYQGLASDSVLSYLDRAGGIDAERGSYTVVNVMRNGKVRKTFNLYDFLLSGQLDLVQFSDGDVIMVQPRAHVFSADGAVLNQNDFEFPTPTVSLAEALRMARPTPGATHVSVQRRQGLERRTEYFPIGQAAEVMLEDGDTFTVTADRYPGTIQIRVSGAHSGQHAMVLPYGAQLRDVLPMIQANPLSVMDAIQLFRKSTKEQQKRMLEVSLNKLEESVLTARSATSEEASLRRGEAELTLNFVEKARQIEPLGQVVLNGKEIGDTILEDGDELVIPERTSLVAVNGGVLFPNAFSWQRGLDADDYVQMAGGFTQSPKTSKVIVVRQNGEAVNAERAGAIRSGDQLVVLPQIETKSLEITRALSTIVYQIAVAAKVVLGL